LRSHAAALELEGEAATLDDVFAESVAALASLSHGDAGERDRVPVQLEGSDVRSLLTRFLDDLLYLAEEEHFVAERLERLQVVGTQLRAAVSGHKGCALPVRGVTCSALEHRAADAWTFRVIYER
jgi:SHS2 domain-containing protein